MISLGNQGIKYVMEHKTWLKTTSVYKTIYSVYPKEKTAMQHEIDENISRIFNLLKVLSIFMVMIGHFFKEYDLLWVPVTVGLLIFSFSSDILHQSNTKEIFSRKKFWGKNLSDLA